MKKLFKKLNYKIVSLVLMLLFAAALVGFLTGLQPVYHSTFTVTGDVENTFTVASFDGYETSQAQRDGTTYKSIALQTLIDTAIPYIENSTVVLRGSDGLLAAVDMTQLDGMYVTYTADNGWEMINDYHPASSNIKNLTEIWVVADEEVKEMAVNIISADENIASYTPGQLFMSATEFAPLFHGESEKTSGAGSFNVAVYTERRYIAVEDIVPEAEYVLVMGAEGRYGYDTSPGSITLIGNTLYYTYSDGKTTMEDVRGILINPPSSSNMDVYNESINNIDNDQRVLVILIDGFGYHQYVYATENGYAPYLDSLSDAKEATTVYLPVSHAGLAAMLTGQPPSVNGIYQRGMSDLNVPDIFKYVTNAGKISAYIEGNINILNTSADPVLNADRNGNGFTDDEVFEAALEAVSSEADYVFVHFHGFDDAGHDYGDICAETMEKITEIDAYIDALAEEFNGTLIITTDHGMHTTQDGGAHGLFQYEDMIIPYISCHIG